ncbi:GIY-YIG nuclease family protein [Sphaerochaeta halotolerans]|uniref:GIY-YIG nuclease family protein n=1 Tax=Sphaerochaeta halotolerans TaxID=2293840 RepID=A0A372MI03_9SPIR|nr:GIY-YIG nuclease family protein [Sphaerochaeta halotolerans]RFU95083.1 GIY-YIG nuclease family protein [Sphaerochaeta halotolerans]
MKDEFDYLEVILEDEAAESILRSIEIKKPSPKTIYDFKDAKEKEIQYFIDKNGREPSLDSKETFEKTLAMRAKVIKDRQAKVQQDRSISEEEELPWNTPEGMDILDSVDLGNTSINDFSDSEIIKKPQKEREEAEFVASATPCKEFNERFQPLFNEAEKAIQSGRRKLVPYQRGELRVGQFYVRRGLLFYINEIYETQRNPRTGDFDGRTHCVFANGTESYLLSQSIRRSMYHGYVVTEDDKVSPEGLKLEKEKNVPKFDVGYIYILKTLSAEPEVKKFRDLHKIGFTRGTVEERIKNASKEKTYLCTEVEVIDRWACQNLNISKLETLVHHFFSAAKVSIRVRDDKGHLAVSNEWYDVPLAEIRKIVPLILNGTLSKYRYDKKLRRVLPISPQD